MPHYRIEGKLTEPMSDKDFIDGMEHGKFVTESHRAYCVLLYYSAVRKSEARRALKEQFRTTPKFLVFEVKRRLKHGIETPPLKIPLKAPYADALLTQIKDTSEGARVFRFSDKTAYNAVRRVRARTVTLDLYDIFIYRLFLITKIDLLIKRVVGQPNKKF